MGNVGSTQHLNLEDVNNEIQSYYKQQQLRHSSKRQQSPNPRRSNFNSNSKVMHWTRSLPHVINNGGVDVVTLNRDIAMSVPTTILPNCKVLPHVNERFKLRPTTNGVILSSGGTISGKREQLHKQITKGAGFQLSQPRGLKQRSQTFIYDDSKNDSWKCTRATQLNFEQCFDLQNCRQSFPAFRRSQTNLGLNIKSDQNQAIKSLRRKMVFASTKTKIAEEELKNIKTGQRQVEDKDQVPSIKNKYNKKRKAPPAPSLSVMPVSKSATSATSSPSTDNKYFTETITNNSYTRMITPTAASDSLLDNKTLLGDFPARYRLFHSNVRISPSKLAVKNLHEPQQQTQNQLMNAEKDFTSLSIASTKDATMEICNHLRREKSSSAILLRQKNTRHDINNEPLITENVFSKSSSLSQLKSKDSKHKNGQQKYSSSKIPQLNRTLYFGMSTRSIQALATAEVVETTRQKDYLINGKNLARYENSENIDTSSTVVIKATTGDLVSDYKTHAPSDIKPIIDNGLLIQVRPTLPRRQLNTSNFSPVVAWHMLVHQQHHHKLQEFKHTCGEKIRKQNNSEDKTNKNEISAKSSLLPYLTRNKNGFQCVRGAAKISKEAPIKLTSNLNKITLSNTWTPQQDLGYEDDDYDEDEADSSEKQFSKSAVPNHIAQQENPSSCAQVNRNSTEVSKLGSPEVSRPEAVGKAISTTNIHVFSLTLPRDVHTKAQRKILQPIYTSSTLPNEPTRSADSTAGSPYKPISKCCCSHGGMKIHQRLPLALDDILPHENNCPIRSDNEIVISASEPLSNLTDNWVLHKVKYDEGVALNTCQISSDGRYKKWNSTASVEPISLSYLTAGKHVMYLPGEEPNTNTTRNGVSCRTTMRKGEQNQYKQQQRRQEIVCQSLRDELTNLGNYTLTASHVPVKAASGIERPQQFTFQSTIRLLEKKRLAERLAKDAKLREAQRKCEMEAMKCVEDDFQRKRVIEKASIRYQVQLHLSAEKVKENGIATVDGNLSPEVPHGLQYDHNNNIACRADPDGAVSNTEKVR
ncbi:uncharacterized protein LOC105222679 [Bactrocera dorsalis]|uniref:Uncharacterized protein LOC105222679 n=1 Tax=Bactrocera dorsalis TaxID=27457 RepID=A0ABM3K443_BACDO|nr:uncharacterized protein LOC105222679 [Bactrocera dorsalis]XP_049316244.1 uncharacterized protein LOC105222679 [Bactrocera dorsalis]XP_049316245.1 uncharacterized protein LOC105222679 [Bactrocera dorsalis]XP_049316246.1 uncharacterized protein LOC105222679 [Bactrocera dorsalis]XP_049316247.1 uncharacterized protein LOC105222679 [Bactrocera dorsalis]XP_049316248.1 uncharacterized protein LOC105222679 [Bactrocera dorsalis]XP_049316249.1 uncharacterized protein LOC105222679 [Bactrocera dorsali